MKITYTTIHHDPEGRCNWLLEKHIDDFKNLFVDRFIVVTQETVDSTTEIGRINRELLEEAGFRQTVRSSSKSRQLDSATDIALIAAEQKGKSDVIMTGLLDRTLHWMDTYPNELVGLLSKGLGELDLLIIGRTERALLTHPKQQLEPELYTNRVTAELLGMKKVDVAAGVPSLMRRDTARTIIDFLKEQHRIFNPEVDINDSAWPIIAKYEGKKLGFVEVEGLEFETPDQYKDEIKRVGYDNWVAENFTADNLERRWERAHVTERKIREFAQAIKISKREVKNGNRRGF